MSSCVGSGNVVDIAACPTLSRSACASASAAATPELCRRLFVDLTGAAPTSDEMDATCKDRSPREIATTLVTTPEWVKHQKELWGEVLGYDPAQVDGAWLADADEVVARFVRGEIGWDAFAIAILGRPVIGVGARLPRSDVIEDDARFFGQSARRAFEIFLGRRPLAGEEESLAKLFGFWRKHIVVLNGDYGRAEPVVDPRACPCESTLFGTPTRIELPLSAPEEWSAVPRSPVLTRELDKVGTLFTAQRTFWTHGAEVSLSMVLGWWRSTKDADVSVLPEVAAALGERLHASTWPALVTEIASSTLYVRANRNEREGANAPVWCLGPTRMMRPEAYVASLGKVLGVRVGRCDHRTYERRGSFYSDGSEGSFFPDALREDEPSDATLLGVADYHWVAASGMGGCSAGAARSEDPTMPVVFGAASAASDICRASSLVVPASVGVSDVSDEAIARIADHLGVLLLGRLPTAAERAAIASDAAECRSQSACTSRAIAVDMCTAFARSAEALTY